MMWLDTKEEVDFDWFMEVLDNDELQVVSRKWTEEATQSNRHRKTVVYPY